jgi:hypothetical protein
LEVDFIGGSGPLTTEEEKAISEYIKLQKKSSKHIPLPGKHNRQNKSKSVV